MNEFDGLNKEMDKSLKGGTIIGSSFKQRVKKFIVTATAMTLMSLIGFAKQSASAQSAPENIRQIEQNVITWGGQLQTMPEDKKQEYHDLLVRYTSMYMQEMIDEVKEYIRGGRYREALTAVQRIRNMAEIVGDDPLLKLANKYEEIIIVKQETSTSNRNELASAIINETKDIRVGQIKTITISNQEYIVSKARARDLSQAQRIAENQIVMKTNKSGQNLGMDVQRENNQFIVTVIRRN